jgi:hypothetical protein
MPTYSQPQLPTPSYGVASVVPSTRDAGGRASLVPPPNSLSVEDIKLASETRFGAAMGDPQAGMRYPTSTPFIPPNREVPPSYEQVNRPPSEVRHQSDESH